MSRSRLIESLVLTLLVVTSGLPAPTAATGADNGESPLANAGLDQSVTPGTTVYLDGGGSVDPDGEIQQYRWSIETPSGESRTPVEPSAAMTRFVPGHTGRYLVQLTVTDDDGNSRSDTLYVDVGGTVDTGASSPVTETESPSAGEPETPPADSVTTPASGGGPVEQNQAPDGDVQGPDTVRAGDSARYVLEASDVDGNVVEKRWQSASHHSGSPGALDPHQSSQTFQFDVEPGTEVHLPAVVVDNDGASSTVSKTVTVTNNPPEAMVQGNSTVLVGTIHQYEVIASDPDGPIIAYDWSKSSAAVERVDTGGLTSGGTLSGTRTALFRFTAVPEDDASATVRATVYDEHGGSATAEKEVTVVASKQNTRLEATAGGSPQISSFQASQGGTERIAFDRDQAQPGRVVFTASATDENSQKLTFEWEFGDHGTAQTVDTGTEATSEVSFAFDRDEVNYRTGEPITLTVTDQNGYTKTTTKTLQFREVSGVGAVEDGLDVSVAGNRLIRGSLNLAGNNGEPPSYVTVFFGDGDSMRATKMEAADRPTAAYEFEHRYQSAGEFVVQAQYEMSIKRTTVSVGARTYTQWVYDRKVTADSYTFAADQPGATWERAGLDHVEYEQLGVQTQRTQIFEGETFVPGNSWERVGTETENHTERRTKRALEAPDETWERSQRNVDEREVFDGWETRTVADRWMAGDDWEYVGRAPRTTTVTQTKESAARPDGDGWVRGEKTGDSVRTGSNTEWVSNRYFAGSNWEYLGSDRYIDGYTESTECVRYQRVWGQRYCVEEETTRSPTYDVRYKYRAPTYADEYEWERSTERTVYDYEYRFKTYSTESVHEYSKDVEVVTRYALWEKPEYNTTNIYRWEKSKTTWERTTSLSAPMGEVRNVEKRVKECGESWDKGEPQRCKEGQP